MRCTRVPRLDENRAAIGRRSRDRASTWRQHNEGAVEIGYRCGVLLCALGVCTDGGGGAAYVVDDPKGSCTGDPGTLFWAIEKANLDGVPSTVEFDASLAGETIQL